HVPRLNLSRIASGQLRDAAVSAVDAVASQATGRATGHAVRCDSPMTRQRAYGHRPHELDATQRAVAAAPSAGAAAAAPNRELSQQYRETPFEHFGIGEPGVGHVRLHHRRPLEPVTGPGAGSDGFVVLMLRIAEGDVV